MFLARWSGTLSIHSAVYCISTDKNSCISYLNDIIIANKEIISNSYKIDYKFEPTQIVYQYKLIKNIISSNNTY